MGMSAIIAMESPTKPMRRESLIEECWEQETPNRRMSSEEFIRSTSPEAKSPAMAMMITTAGSSSSVTLFPATEPSDDDALPSMVAPSVTLFPQDTSGIEETYEIPAAPLEAKGSKQKKEKNKDNQRPKRSRGKNKKCGNEELGPAGFTDLARRNLMIWKSHAAMGVAEVDMENNSNVQDIEPVHIEEGLVLDIDFWDFESSTLTFTKLNSKFRHCLHEVCEELNLAHESIGSATDRVVTVSRDQKATGHDLSKATYGCQYHSLDVPKQKTKAALWKLNSMDLDYLGEVLSRLKEFEANDDYLYGGRALFSLSHYPNYDENFVHLVDSEDDLRRLANTLGQCKRFGFDLEWHSYRSYLGVTCTIQIATEDGTVYVIDALKCFDFVGDCLGPIFSEASIMKCALSLDQDVAFLFRDFGIISRGVVDLQRHAGLLSGNHSLGLVAVLKLCECHENLLTTLIGHKESTRQEDWRTRPLSEDMLFYAGMDSYYLLPCLDIISSRLLEEFGYVPKDTIRTTAQMVQSSLRSALKAAHFSVSPWRANKFYRQHIAKVQKMKKKNGGTGLKKKDKEFVGKNEHVLRLLYAWREEEAFKSDESLHYIASPLLLYLTALHLPTSVDELLDMITKARAGYPERDLDVTAPIGIRAADLPSPSLEARQKACMPLLNITNEAIGSYEKSVSVTVPNGYSKIIRVHLSVAIATFVLLNYKRYFNR